MCFCFSSQARTSIWPPLVLQWTNLSCDYFPKEENYKMTCLWELVYQWCYLALNVVRFDGSMKYLCCWAQTATIPGWITDNMQPALLLSGLELRMQNNREQWFLLIVYLASVFRPLMCHFAYYLQSKGWFQKNSAHTVVETEISNSTSL